MSTPLRKSRCTVSAVEEIKAHGIYYPGSRTSFHTIPLTIQEYRGRVQHRTIGTLPIIDNERS